MNNKARDGGGASCLSYGSILEENIVSHNSAGRSGGGIFGSRSVIQNNVISFNTADEFGGGVVSRGDTVRNNTIYANTAAMVGGGLSESPYYEGTSINNIIWNNEAFQDPQIGYTTNPPTYSCIQGLIGYAATNIHQDPLLADPENGDYHLLPGSPCIDAGAFIDGVTTDFDGEPRPLYAVSDDRGDGSQFDIGADEALVISIESIRDHILERITLQDFILSMIDFNDDGRIDIADLILFVWQPITSKPLYKGASVHELQR
jgi:hypothetical protein